MSHKDVKTPRKELWLDRFECCERDKKPMSSTSLTSPILCVFASLRENSPLAHLRISAIPQ
jgi:hypothetical protein